MKASAAALLLFTLLPVVLGANPFRRLLENVEFCQEKATVCKLDSGGFGCCPAVDAVCCTDGEHCCPSGFKCDLNAKSCLKYGDPAFYILSEDMLDVMPIETSSRAAREITKGSMEVITTQQKLNIVCPGGMSNCPTNNTCCKTKDPSKYGCCPRPDAVCCEDMTHCCPEGYACNDKSGTCLKSAPASTSALLLLVVDEVDTVTCPGGRSYCPNGNTCCELVDGNYGCCPIVNAVCCIDHLHCCPNGYSCGEHTCTHSDPYTKLLMKKPLMALQKQQTLENVICPDHKVECPDENTCCLTASKAYGCCPVPNATCCPDKKHCCPQHYHCDTDTGTCMKSDIRESVVVMEQLVMPSSPMKVMCPNDVSMCPDGNTCCPIGSTKYDCCPMLNATCCSDGKHCCPEGYRCDETAGSCIKMSEEDTTFIKQEGLIVKDDVRHVFCPDGGICPDYNTCCKLISGNYGCCPGVNEVCCDYGTACCPSNSTCCQENGCCPSNAVCCQDGSCCPSNYAVCCEGGGCCPTGYYCDPSTEKCFKEAQTSISAKLVADIAVRNVICPDGGACPDGNTCCKLAGGNYGCCPHVDAVCCADGKHCCPSGYTCNLSTGTCTKGTLTATSTELVAKDVVRDVTCPDRTTACPDGNTCCKLAGGNYGCCPISEAICCKDGLHCCPKGYTCNVKKGSCTKSSLGIMDRIPFLAKPPVRRL